MALTRVVYFSLIFVIALYLQNGLHRSALESGLTLLTWIVAFGAENGLVAPRDPPWANAAGNMAKQNKAEANRLRVSMVRLRRSPYSFARHVCSVKCFVVVCVF